MLGTFENGLKFHDRSDTQKMISKNFANKKETRLDVLTFDCIKSALPDLLSGMSNSLCKISEIDNCLRGLIFDEEGWYTSGEIQLNDCIHTATSLLNHLFAKKVRRFEVKTASSLPLIMGAKQQIELVVIATIMHVYKALEDNLKGISLRSCISEDEQYARIEMAFEIANNVPGDLFVKSSHCEPDTENDNISLCNRIIKNHGGSVCYELLSGIGAEVIMEFPRLCTEGSSVTFENPGIEFMQGKDNCYRLNSPTNSPAYNQCNYIKKH
jgi:hypothetical protein